MPRTMTVALLKEGGKYVAIDFKHIPQGDPHRRVGFVDRGQAGSAIVARKPPVGRLVSVSAPP